MKTDIDDSRSGASFWSARKQGAELDEQRHAPIVEDSWRAPPPPAALVKILLVEDEVDIRENTREMMELLGYAAVAVGTAEEAMQHLSPDVDILMTDLKLPGIQGDDLAQLAKTRFPHMRMLLASGFGAVGVTGVETLAKPYTLKALQAALSAMSPEASCSMKTVLVLDNDADVCNIAHDA